MLSCRLGRRSGRKRTKGFFFVFLLFVAASSDRFGAASPKGELLTSEATTTPLSENGDGCSTLEGATEQQQQWEEETLQLLATHKREISTLQATLHTLQATHSTLQHEYQTLLWNQIAFFEEQLSLQDDEMAQLQQKLQSIHTENAELLLTVMSNLTDYMTRTAERPAVDTKQHNTTTDHVLLQQTSRSHHGFCKGAFQKCVLELLEGWWAAATTALSSHYWETVATLDGAEQIMYDWMSNVLVPNLQDAQSHLMTRFQQESARYFQIVKGAASLISDRCYTMFDADIMTYEQGLRQGVEISQTLLVSLIRLLASFADWISDSFREVCKLGYQNIVAPWVIIQQAHHHTVATTRQALKNLHHLHQGVVLVFDFCVVAASNYVLTNCGGNRDHWIYKILLFVKSNNTSLLVALLEVLVGLAILQSFLAAFLRRYRPNREQRVKTIQSRGHELSISLSRRSNHHTSISKSSLSCSTQQSQVSLRSNHPNQHFYSNSSRRRSTDELSIGGWSTTEQQVVSEIQSCCSDRYY